MGVKWAVVDATTGIVLNTILWDGEQEYVVEDGLYIIQSEEANMGWIYIDDVFTPPQEEILTKDQVRARNSGTQQVLLSSASLAMTPYLLSLQLGNPTENELIFADLWQTYYRELQNVDLTREAPSWPELPIL